MKSAIQTHAQASAYDSPWPLHRRIALLVWEYVWALTCSWTPKPLNPWRLFVLRIFGAKLHGTPFVHQRARVQQPWNLTMHHRACLGDRANAYSLAPITLEEGCTIAQEAYLCTGTHDFAHPDIPLQTAPIVVGRDVFVGARAFVLPGVTLAARCVVGAAAVVTRDVAAGVIVAGNPAKPIGSRPSS
ncbi:MAG TPA: DapH/DapD/GlmU-related protein [Opitutaceae bacterium]|nr:DapH/DapD/GlmU-related protein [Opitutaceae bacterium]